MKKIAIVIISVLVVALGTSAVYATVNDASKNVQVTRLSPTTATIAWSSKDAAQSRVHYGQSIILTDEVSDLSLKTSHEITLTNLVPGVTYTYRIADNTNTPFGDTYTLTTPYKFGVLSGSIEQYIDESRLAGQYANGIKYRTFELAWDRVETADGIFDATYINTKKVELEALQAHGYGVVLDLGVQYSPGWVRSLDANALFRNQYGNTYAPAEAGKDVANTVFNQSVRNKLDAYIDRVFQEFGTDFTAVRAGGGWYGELHYPTGDYAGRTNAFWGYDSNAQGITSNLPAGISANPVPGWIPNPVENGTFENGDDGNWILSGTDSVSADSNRGARALVKVNPGAFTNQTQQQNIPLVVGRSYTISARVKSTNPSSPACFQLTRPISADEITFQCSGSGTYTEISHTFTAQDTTVNLALLTWNGAATTLTYDDITITANGYSYDADNSDARAFLEWYSNSLANYQNWQIDAYRNAGYNGQIYMMYPGYGTREDADVNWAEESISYDLSNTSIGNTGGGLQRGENWHPLIGQLPVDDANIAIYTTWIDGTFNDADTDAADWSPAKYLASVASGTNRELYGENTGFNSQAQMAQAVNNMKNNNYSGLFWFDDPQLYDGTHASLNDYRTLITTNDQTAPYGLVVGVDSLSTDRRQVELTLDGVDNVDTASNLLVEISQDSSFDEAVTVPYEDIVTYISDSPITAQYLFIRITDQQGNVSNVFAVAIPTVEDEHSEGGASAPGAPNTGFMSSWENIRLLMAIAVGVAVSASLGAGVLFMKKRQR